MVNLIFKKSVSFDALVDDERDNKGLSRLANPDQQFSSLHEFAVAAFKFNAHYCSDPSIAIKLLHLDSPIRDLPYHLNEVPVIYRHPLSHDFHGVHIGNVEVSEDYSH